MVSVTQLYDEESNTERLFFLKAALYNEREPSDRNVYRQFLACHSAHRMAHTSRYAIHDDCTKEDCYLVIRKLEVARVGETCKHVN